MTDKKISELPAATTPLAGTEYIPLAQSGTTVKSLLTTVGRIRLTANTTYYVACTTGSDVTGNGSSSTPWQTLAFANSYIRSNLDFNGFQVFVRMKEAGVYTGFRDGGGYLGGGSLFFVGDTNSPSSYIVQDDGVAAGGVFQISQQTGTVVNFDQLTFRPTASFVDCVTINSKSTGRVGLGPFAHNVAIDFATNDKQANCFIANGGGQLFVFGSVAITVPVTKKIGTVFGSFGLDDNNSGASLLSAGPAMTFSGNVGFATHFAFCDSNSIIGDGGSTFTWTVGGATSGSRFLAELAGIIDTGTGNPNFYPGTVAGSTATNGLYL